MLVISGATKPLVAIVLALVVFLILDLKIVEILSMATFLDGDSVSGGQVS
jgi:hypothetical protein